MSALLLELKRATAHSPAGRRDAPTPLALAAAIAVALAPWLLLVGAHGGLARSAAACLAGPLPV
jgi:hypothetical protein